MKCRLQSRAASSQQPARAVDSPYLTLKEALQYLRFRTRQVLYYHIKENGLPVLRAGRALRFDKRDLDDWLRGTDAITLRRVI